jgi:hypothetical protein
MISLQICVSICRGYEVAGVILLRCLNGAMRLDRSKDMSVHVSTCTVTISTHYREICRNSGADKNCVFLRLVAKMSDRFLEHRISITFCVKLGKNASDPCAMLSETYGGEDMKNSYVFERHKRLK